MITETIERYGEELAHFYVFTMSVNGVRTNIGAYSGLMVSLRDDPSYATPPMRWSPNRDLCDCKSQHCRLPHEPYDGRSSP